LLHFMIICRKSVYVVLFALFKFTRTSILLDVLGRPERTFVYDFKTLNKIWIQNVKIG